jgi:hypothetical protein
VQNGACALHLTSGPPTLELIDARADVDIRDKVCGRRAAKCVPPAVEPFPVRRQRGCTPLDIALQWRSPAVLLLADEYLARVTELVAVRLPPAGRRRRPAPRARCAQAHLPVEGVPEITAEYWLGLTAPSCFHYRASD